jgi:hypothetical protein
MAKEMNKKVEEENSMKEKELERTGFDKKSKNALIWNHFDGIPYVKQLRKLELVNSITACLLMARLEILFAENPDYFCKYLTPGSWQSKFEGLSWTDELMISRGQFWTAFDQIGVRYRTKAKYLKAEDIFKGKYYCCYVDTTGFNKTYYFRNDELVDKCIKRLIAESSSSTPDSNLKENSEDLSLGLRK